MIPFCTRLIVLVSVILVGIAAPEVLAADSSWVASDSTGQFYVIETRHRMYPNFLQVDTIGLHESFTLGEEDYVVEILTFNPHLGITEKGEYLQMSDTLYNPAVRLRVSLADSVVQESWGFHLVSAPHFYRQHMFGFRLLDFYAGPAYIAAPPKESPTEE